MHAYRAPNFFILLQGEAHPTTGAPDFSTLHITPGASLDDGTYPYHVTLGSRLHGIIANQLLAEVGYAVTFSLYRLSTSEAGTAYGVRLGVGTLGALLRRIIHQGLVSPGTAYHISM